jgi:hypothetical protein
LDAYILALTASQSAITSALALVPNTARAVLPTPGDDLELYVNVSETSATALLTKIAQVVTISGLAGVEVHLAYGTSTTEAAFPTHGIVDSYVGFILLTALPGDVVDVYEAALQVTGVVGAAMVTGSVNVLVEVTAGSESALATIVAAVEGLPDVLTSASGAAATSTGAGFVTS